MIDFIAGCLGGSAGLIVGYPLDTIKVHLQVQNTKNPTYRGTWHCFQSILHKESIHGLYRGMSSPLAGVAALNAIVFGVYAQAQKHIIKDPNNLTSHFFAGALAGLAQAPIICPLELAKMRLQLQENSVKSPKKIYSGPITCMIDILRQKGIRGVFTGFWVTVVREVPSLGLYFSTYELLTRNIYFNFANKNEITTFHMLMAGGFAGIGSWLFTYPIDVIKSRIQADQNGRYKGSIDCLKKSVREDGVKCLFRGLNSTILRAFPTNAVTFTVVHWTLRLFNYEEIVKEDLKVKEEKGVNICHDNYYYLRKNDYEENYNDYKDKFVRCL
ncbi:mitochondrial basic amino acids transporter isoform X2 [Cotesia glomerata]|uniref:mitochondrial basic amino acids transporter isoform X2 n=1 Tax=Cotesia glomerata TaxID=32391 RepID=UPI001D0274AB|nr:mitochondrial basic amino acids transporter isoform X2 [Cotesia glomerata]